MKTKILWEDGDVIIAYKPAGFPVQSAKPGMPDMESELRSYLKYRDADISDSTGRSAFPCSTGQRKPSRQVPYLGIIHRLDQPVEGLLVFARNKKTAAALSGQLTDRTLHKQYQAVVCGYPPEEKGSLVDYLRKDGKMQKAIVFDSGSREAERVSAPDAGSDELQNGKEGWKKAILRYERKETLSAPYAISLLNIHIQTGRFHQIRAQLAHAGMPLLGDPKYGNENSGKISAALGIRTVALCADSLSFVHPATGKRLDYRIQPEGTAFGLFSSAI